jgi:hypothetical protein
VSETFRKISAMSGAGTLRYPRELPVARFRGRPVISCGFSLERRVIENVSQNARATLNFARRAGEGEDHGDMILYEPSVAARAQQRA